MSFFNDDVYIYGVGVPFLFSFKFDFHHFFNDNIYNNDVGVYFLFSYKIVVKVANNFTTCLYYKITA